MPTQRYPLTDLPTAGQTFEPSRLLEEFPIKKHRVYFNNASIGVIPCTAIAAVNTFLSDVQAHGRNNYPEWCTYADTVVKESVATLIDATPDEIAFTKNTTEGINIVAAGLDWRAGDNVIIPDIEYPSNVYPWMKLRQKGVELKWAKSQDGTVPPAVIEGLIDKHTRLVSVSAVQFSNGYRQDLAALSAICVRRGALLHLDAIQWVGALKMSVADVHIDYMSVGAHKWLLGPIGIGFFYCRKSALDVLDPPSVGYHTVDKGEDHLDYDLDYRPNAGRFEEALVNFPGIWGLNAAIALQLKLGPPRIEQHITSLLDQAEEGVRSKGYRIVTPRTRLRSGILSFDHPTIPAEHVVARLREGHVDVAARGGSVRISPTYYNDSNELMHLLDTLV